MLTAPRPRGLWSLIQKKRKNEVRASVAVCMPHHALGSGLGNGWRTIVYDANVPVDDGTTRTAVAAATQLLSRWLGRWRCHAAHA